MGFGLRNAPATFQKIVKLIMARLNYKEILAYLDDIMVQGTNFEKQLKNLCATFDWFRKYNLKINLKKYCLFQTKVTFLGKLVNEHGVRESIQKMLKK